jgi:ABC-type iron transport system FetAB ATPase subunit
MLRVDHLRVPGLGPVSFALASGECVALGGPSGSGKTRLLRAVADLDRASGHIFLEGAERREMPGPAWRRLVRYCTGEAGWWSETARPAMGANSRVASLVASLGLDEAILDRPLALLSTGERARLALVRALSGAPKVLLLDEPTAALDPPTAALVEELIRYQLLLGRGVLLVTHDAAQARRLARRSMTIESGEVVMLEPAPLPMARPGGFA